MFSPAHTSYFDRIKWLASVFVYHCAQKGSTVGFLSNRACNVGSQFVDWQFRAKRVTKLTTISQFGDVMRKILAALGALWVLMPAVSLADGVHPVVVELYTSQGCASCPPADALLAELKDREDLIALSLHVDYWDYLGWKDEMASPKFTKRQKDYARVAGSRSIYTPQMIVGGTEPLVGYKAMQLADAIAEKRAQSADVHLSLSLRGGKLSIAAEPQQGLPRKMIVQLVRYHPGRDVNIRRGENAGRVITYTNIVNSWEQIGTWDGRKPLSLRAPISGEDQVVVIVQEQGPGEILAAARLER